MIYFFKELFQHRLVFPLILIFLVVGCNSGGGGSNTSTVDTEESFPDAVTLSTVGTYYTLGESMGLLKDGNYIYVADGDAGLLILEITNDTDIEKIGSLQLNNGGFAFSLAKSGDYLYLAGGNDGLVVIDVSDPENPVRISSDFEYYDEEEMGKGEAGYITIEGDTLYLTTRYPDGTDFTNGFLIFDISTPDKPISVGGISEYSNFADSVISNQVAYVSGDKQKSLNLVYISEPAYTKIIGVMNVGVGTGAVAKYGDYLLLGGNGSKLFIYNIQDVYPVDVASLTLTDNPNPAYANVPLLQISIQDHYAYIADGLNGFFVVDIEDISSPTVVTHLDMPGYYTDVYLDGDTLVAADTYRGIHLINIAIETDSDGDHVGDSVDALPNDATESVDSDGDGIGDNADQDDDNDMIVDRADAFPYDPNEWKDTDSDGVGDNSDVFPEDPSEWKDSDGDGVGDNADAFPEDPSKRWPDAVSLTNLDTQSASNFLAGVLKDGDFIYAADGLNGLRIFRITGNSEIDYIASVELSKIGMNSGRAYSLAKSGDYIYLAGGFDGLLVIDVSSPGNPVSIPSPPIPGSVTLTAIEGNTLYVTTLYQNDTNGLFIIDISVPNAPVVVGNISSKKDISTFAKSAISNQVAYVTGGSTKSLNLLDISEPSNTEIMDILDIGVETWAVATYGDYLLLGGSYSELFVYDIKGDKPVYVTSFALTDSPDPGQGPQALQQIAVQGRYAYIADGLNGLFVVDLINISSPSVVTRLDISGYYSDVYIDGETLVAANTFYGIHLINIETNPDSDGDGVGDNEDAFPDDASETVDTDGDDIGNNADKDDDGDGVQDTDDAFPLDPTETKDSDGDGVGDNSDLFPADSSEWQDTDGDGVGDNADVFPDNPAEWDDTDSDGVGDNEDAFPDDASETVDTDGDGVGDNADTDDDDDTVLDVDDAFPLDPTETVDSDGDGVGENSDVFPADPYEWQDTDGDGVGDNEDAFPDDASETVDTDGDGVGDNADTDDDGDTVLDVDDDLPLDPTETVDSDGDSVGDNSDVFPADPAEWDDTDGDGTGDEADIDDDDDGILDDTDNCPFIANNDQTNSDSDIHGDACDNCLDVDNDDQVDIDEDGSGNACDLDDDGDGRTDITEDFPFDIDTDNDQKVNVIDNDDDNDGFVDLFDTFPLDEEEWEDLNGDGLGDNIPNNRYAVIEVPGYGTIKLELFEDLVPLTTKNFIQLANDGFYDGVLFHRVISGFVIQGGDPLGTGMGGPGYSIVDEFPLDDSEKLILSHDFTGVLSMANSGPNTGGSQFFITLAPQPQLDGGYTVFGQVVEGMDVVQEIGAVQTYNVVTKNRPIIDIIMNQVYITTE